MLQSLAKDTCVYGGADLLGKLIAFLTFPLIAKVLSPHDFGVLDLVMTAVGLFGLIVGCGMSNAVQRFYWENNHLENEAAAIVSSGLFLQIIFGLGFIILAFILIIPTMSFISEKDVDLTFYALCAAIIMVPASQWLQYIQDVTRLRFAKWKFLFLSVFVKILGAILAVLAVVVFHGGVNGYLLVMCVVFVAVLPIGLWLIKDDLTFTISRKWALELLHFGYPFIFVVLAHWLLGSMDRWMLASMSSIAETGIYGVGHRFATLVLFVSTAFGMAWSPYSMKMRTDHPEKYPEICGHVLLFLLYGMLFFGGGLALFSGEIISLIMPEAYGSASYVLAILCFAIVLQATMQVTAVGISLAKKTYIFMHLAWVAALVNFVGNWVLIPYSGAAGAAWATLLTYVLLTTLYLYFTQRLVPIVIFWRRTIWLLFLGGFIAYLSLSLNQDHIDWNVILTKIIIAIICIVAGVLALPIKEVQYVKKT